MERIILVGAGEGSVDIVREALKEFEYNEDIDVAGVVFDAEELHNTLFDGRFRVKNFDDMAGMQFDKVYICARSNITREVERIICEGLDIPGGLCVSYLQPRAGGHYVELAYGQNDLELYNKIAAMPDLNGFEKFFYSTGHRPMRKWLHYLDIYNRHLEKYIGKAPVVMEIGVYRGGSLQMWKNYFGEGTRVIGIDITPETKEFEEDGITIEIGSQDDREFWKYLKEMYPNVDILIDDGGHRMEQQIVTFEEGFPHLSPGGCYICEDLHTSYWERFGGRYKDESTFVEYSKNFIDYINAWNSETPELTENTYSRTMHGVHYYTSMLVIEKEKVGYPRELMIGHEY